jgi:hypothetical protein
MSSFANAFAAMTATIKQLNGITVTLASGTSSSSVTAIAGQSTFPIEDSAGLLTSLQTRDYLISATDFKLNGAPVEPSVGMTITETLAGVNYVYKVISPNGEAAWRWSDPQRIKYRVHTKLASSAPA